MKFVFYICGFKNRVGNIMGGKRAGEYLPWYRQKKYKGNLSEPQKRMLDAFRLEEDHPSASYETLPEEVQNYINSLEIQIYDAKQSGLFWGCAFVSFMGGISIQRWWQYPDSYGPFTLIVGVIVFTGAWIIWYYQQKKNARDFLPDDDPSRPTDEAIRKHWELNYLRSIDESDPNFD